MSDQIVRRLDFRILKPDESERVAQVKKVKNPMTNIYIEALEQATKKAKADFGDPLQAIPYGISMGPFDTEAQAQNARYNANQAAAFLHWGEPDEVEDPNSKRVCPLRHVVNHDVSGKWYLDSVRIRE